MDKEEWIRRRAYNIWCAEGWPKGRDKEHWQQACKEAELEDGLTGADEDQPKDKAGTPPVNLAVSMWKRIAGSR